MRLRRRLRPARARRPGPRRGPRADRPPTPGPGAAGPGEAHAPARRAAPAKPSWIAIQRKAGSRLKSPRATACLARPASTNDPRPARPVTRVRRASRAPLGQGPRAPASRAPRSRGTIRWRSPAPVPRRRSTSPGRTPCRRPPGGPPCRSAWSGSWRVKRGRRRHRSLGPGPLSSCTLAAGSSAVSTANQSCGSAAVLALGGSRVTQSAACAALLLRLRLAIRLRRLGKVVPHALPVFGVGIEIAHHIDQPAVGIAREPVAIPLCLVAIGRAGVGGETDDSRRPSRPARR